MTKTVLVTGGYGFLGRAAGLRFKNAGYRVVGVGHGRWDREQFRSHGFDEWLDAAVTMSGLMTLDERFDVVVHCAGNGSVGYSHSNPLQDFEKTVASSAELLEYIRLNNPSARLIYPSSAGVYGAKADAPIKEIDQLNPVSTYGYHKRIVEELCGNYSQNYGLSIGIIRFFSVYGQGLTKQLLWDASTKLSTANGEAVFWGTGNETRDWIHVDDATHLILKLAESTERFSIVNGAAGARVTVKTVVEMLREALGVDLAITFNGAERIGDPRYYHADVSTLRELGLVPTIALPDGLRSYAAWFRDSSWSK
jgi:UDP-glucose 4-epimerase